MIPRFLKGMPMPGRFAVPSVAAAVLVLASGGAARAKDEEIFEDEIVRKTTAGVIGVKIVRDDWQVVHGKMGMEGGISVPASDVMETVYAEATPDFLRGIMRYKRGFYSQAIDRSFKPTLDKVKKFHKLENGREWPLQYCLYYLGQCHLKRGSKAGDAAKAREYFERLIKEVPDSRFIFDAYIGIGDSLLVERKYTAAADAFATAQKRFEEMSRLPRDIEVVTAIRKMALEAHFRQGEMIEMAGENDRTMYDRAVGIFNSVATNARKYPDLYFRAKAAAVRALVSTGAYKVAIDEANKLIAEGERRGYTEYLGGAYLGLADCYFTKYTDAEEKGENADPRSLVVARYNYLRVTALYFEDRSVLPKAHFRAGRCYERLAQAGEGRKAVERAKRHYRLVEGFTGSPWAAKAKSRLTALGK